MKKILIVVVLLITQAAFAQIPQPSKNTYVNDFAGVLTKAQITGLNKTIFEIEKKDAVQLAIVLVDKIPASYDIQDFAVLIGKKWHVGKKQRGLVYVAAITQHQQRIEVARGLDTTFTNAKCTEIMNYMKESFRNKDYNGGLQILVDQISSKLQGSTHPADPVAQAQPASASVPPGHSDNYYAWVGFIAIAIPVILIILYMRGRNRKRNAMINSMGSNAPGFYNPNNNIAGGYPGPNYGQPGYGQPPYGTPPNHTLRNVAAGAVLGAAAGYAARTIQDHMSQQGQQPQGTNNDTFGSSSNSDNNPVNWGNWGGDSGSSSDNSSYDSGFSDDNSSSDDSTTNSGATSDW